MSVITKKGDYGNTSTLNGNLTKGNSLLDILGEIDQLNTLIGLIRYHGETCDPNILQVVKDAIENNREYDSGDYSIKLSSEQLTSCEKFIEIPFNDEKTIGEFGYISNFLNGIQNKLFNISSQISYFNIDEKYISNNDLTLMINLLEKNVYEMERVLPKLKTFILPGGNLLACNSHLARCQTRKVERMLVKLRDDYINNNEDTNFNINNLIYIIFNRLSDYFFTLSRYYNFLLNNDNVEYNKDYIFDI